MVRTPARSRCSPPPMCIRQEVSAAQSTSACVSSTAAHLVTEHRRRGVGVLDGEGASEAAALGDIGQLDQVDALAPRARAAAESRRHAARAGCGKWHDRSPDAGNTRPHLTTPARLTRNSLNSYTRGTSASTCATSRRVATQRRRLRVEVADHADARGRGCDNHLGLAETSRQSGAPGGWLRAGSRCCSASARNRSAPQETSTVWPSRSSRRVVAMPTCGNSVSLKHVTNSATRIDLISSCSGAPCRGQMQQTARPPHPTSRAFHARGSNIRVGVRRAIARISASVCSSPRPTSCMSALPSAVASVGPAMTGIPDASASH